MSDESKLQQIQQNSYSQAQSSPHASHTDMLHSTVRNSSVTVIQSTNPNEKNCWVKMSECDDFIGPKRSKHTMCSYRNSLYVFGGDNGKHMLNDLITYDCTNNSWSRALNNSPPTPRYHHTAVVYQNSMFVFGGYTGDLNSNSNLCNKNDLYEYKFSSGQWIPWNTASSAAPVPRAAHGAVVYDHKLWIFAGYDGNARLNDMWMIQLNGQGSKSWTEIEQGGDQPATVCNFPLTTCGDAMYLFSGQSGAKTSNQLYKFCFKTLIWSKISSNNLLSGNGSPPERRSGHIMVAHDNLLYIYGGVLGNSFFHEIYSFDLDSKDWSLISMQNQMQPSGRSFLAAAVQNECLYLFGGNGDQNARSNEIYRLKLPNQPKSTLKDDFYRLLQNQMLCDLKLVCSNGQLVFAHCAMVACRSAYCRQLIRIAKEKRGQNDKKPAQKDNFDTLPFFIPADEHIELKIETEKPTAVKIVLEFLYTDRILSLESRESEIDTLKLVVDVYKVAYQFMIPKLKKICENLIELSLTCANILALLRYTHFLNLHALKECCMRYLAKDLNFNQVINFKEFEQLESALMVEIIRLRQNTSSRSSPQDAFILEKCSNLEQDMENFIKKDNEFADILIMLEEGSKPIPAHRCFLAARCAYFEAFFRSFMPKERKIIMTIGDTVPPRQACVSLLHYIYYDDVSMPPEDALYLFSASHYFQFSNLRLHIFCKQNLEVNVSKNNVFDILEAADKIHEKDMKNFALKILRSNFYELAHSSRIRKLPKELLLDIITDISSLFVKDAQKDSLTLVKKTALTQISSFNSYSSEA